ncbi:hypothetical protein ACFPRL_36335 [Pseudoclavibacter helvolus]
MVRTRAVFCITAFSASCFASRFSNFFFANSAMEVSSAAPATVQPIGPARARSAPPAAVPPPPAATAPPPSHAMAALLAAAPESVEIAVPVDAVPKVVATHIAAVGATLATAAPAVMPAPAPAADARAAWRSFCANASASRNCAFRMSISWKSVSNDFGVLATLFTRNSTSSMRSVERSRWRRREKPLSLIAVKAALYSAIASSYGSDFGAFSFSTVSTVASFRSPACSTSCADA